MVRYIHSSDDSRKVWQLYVNLMLKIEFISVSRMCEPSVSNFPIVLVLLNPSLKVLWQLQK